MCPAQWIALRTAVSFELVCVFSDVVRGISITQFFGSHIATENSFPNLFTTAWAILQITIIIPYRMPRTYKKVNCVLYVG